MVQRLKPRVRPHPAEQEVLAQPLATLALHRRDSFLAAVALSATELLHTPDLHKSLPQVIERIGRTIDVDRVHIFEVDAVSSFDRGPILQHYVWSAPDIATPPDFKGIKADMADVGLGSWMPRLARGETITIRARDLDESGQALLKIGNVKSVLAVPVFVDGQWWGLIAFDSCRGEREWAPTEIRIFDMLAELVGTAVARARHLTDLADANRIIENSPTILYRLSPRAPYQLTFMSQNAQRYGYSAAELLASPERWPQIIVSEDLPAMFANIISMVDGRMDENHTEFRVQKPDGSRVWFEGHGYALRDADKQLIGIEGILTDITERVSAAEKIAELARTDFVTGLPNRRVFLERLALAFARAGRGASPFAVLYLDLDQFKDVNDTLGHAVGDALLRTVGDRLTGCVRETDLVARFGGDEFAVLQDGMTDLASAEHLAVKIGEAIAAPCLIGGNQVHTTVSIGVVPYADDESNVQSMMMKADLALYRAKDAGRNQFRFHDAELDGRVHERVQIGNDLHQAIEHNEFELYYQPQVDLTSGRTVGLEALIRWNHPTRGPLMPSTFIPIAESNGSVLPIGEWVIEQACRQFRAWRDQGIAPPVVAVNVSAAQFRLAGDLDRIVAEGLAKYDVAANQLELELTESVLIETTEKHREAFERLRRIGVRLAIDDFGTGYSSLDYLRSFRVSRLKIDRRFIQDMTTNADDAIIVRATIGLGRELGIEVLAEGVETAAQQAFLISAGCKLAQGNYFGEPMSVDGASALLQRKTTSLPKVVTLVDSVGKDSQVRS